MRGGLSLTLLCLCIGCATVSPWEQAGAEFGKGMTDQLNKDAPHTVENIFKSAGESIRGQVLTEETNAKLAEAVEAVGQSATQQLPAVREELVGKATEERLERILLRLLMTLEQRSPRTARGIMGGVADGIHDDVLDERTEQRLNELLKSLGSTARSETALLRDEVLSPQTDAQMRAIVATAMGEVVNASEEIRQKARAELTFWQKNANETLILVAVIGAIIAFFIWRQKEKNRILLNLLMSQVHTTTGDKEREIFGRLEEQANQLGVKGPLQSALKKVMSGNRGPSA